MLLKTINCGRQSTEKQNYNKIQIQNENALNY
jgi:hypothetical protein